MKKILTKSLAVFLAMLMCLTFAPFAFAEGEAVEEPAAPVFKVELKSETDKEAVITVTLTKNEFKCLDFALLGNENLKLTKIVFNPEIFIYDGGTGSGSSNTENGMLSIARPDSFVPDFEIAAYTFEKLSPTGVKADDFIAEIVSCGLEGKIDVTDTAVIDMAIPAEHVHVADGEWTETEPSTCGKTGVEVRYCGICGETAETRDTAKKEHANKQEETVDATCTQDGYTIVICLDCGETISSTPIPAGHGETYIDHKDPTCTEDGYDKEICKDCGAIVNETPLTAGNHVNKETEHKDPTCTEDGYDKVICKDCGITVSETSIPATGHSDETIIDRTLPTCTEDGSIKDLCSVCNAVVAERTIPKLGHDYIQDIQLPTCTEDGHSREYCPTCGDSKHVIPLPSTGHSWLDWVVITQPTYAKEGVERRVCNNCGAAEERSTPKLIAKPTEIVLNMQEAGMNFRQTMRLFANVYPEEAAYSADIIWESSDENVLTVNEYGEVYAANLGTATITAKTADGSVSATCEITVKYSTLQWIIVYILFGWIWYL